MLPTRSARYSLLDGWFSKASEIKSALWGRRPSAKTLPHLSVTPVIATAIPALRYFTKPPDSSSPLGLPLSGQVEDLAGPARYLPKFCVGDWSSSRNPWAEAGFALLRKSEATSAIVRRNFALNIARKYFSG